MYIHVVKRGNVRIIRIILDLHDVTVDSKRVVLFENEMHLTLIVLS